MARQVLYAGMFKWMVVAEDDSVESMQARVRALVPDTVSESTAETFAKPFPRYVAPVFWSERYQCYWFKLPAVPKTPFRLDSSRMPDDLRDRVPTKEPRVEPAADHAASSPA